MHNGLLLARTVLLAVHVVLVSFYIRMVCVFCITGAGAARLHQDQVHPSLTAKPKKTNKSFTKKTSSPCRPAWRISPLTTYPRLVFFFLRRAARRVNSSGIYNKKQRDSGIYRTGRNY
jgi:hypothetical protein